MLSHDALDVSADQYLDVIPSLKNVHTVEHVHQSHAFEREYEYIVNQIEGDIGGQFVWSSDREVVDLAFEQDTFAIDDAGIEA